MVRWVGALVAVLALLGAGVLGARAYREHVVVPAERAAVLETMAGRVAVLWRGDLWLVAARSGARQRVNADTRGRALTAAAWAPDGGRLALSLHTYLTGQSQVTGGLYLIPVEGGEPRLLLNEGAPGTLFDDPRWTPAGDELVYAYSRFPQRSGEAQISRIERVAADGGAREVLVEDGQSPAVAPDGQAVAFVRRGIGGDALLLIEAGTVRPLVPPGQLANVVYPRFAPDGETIAFTAATVARAAEAVPSHAPAAGRSDAEPLGLLAHRIGVLVAPPIAHAHGLPGDVWIVRRDGSGLRRVTDLAEDDPSVAWAPDGRWLALRGGDGLSLVERDTGRAVRLATGADQGPIDWGP